MRANPRRRGILKDMLAGVISDTHGYLDDRVRPHFEGVDLILHAGDVGSSAVIEELERIAPVFAVEGNNDIALALGLEPRLALILEGHRVQVVHEAPHAQPGYRIVVHGHSHRMLNQWRGDVLWLNPGAAGRQGFHTMQTVALLRLEAGVTPVAELIALGPRLPSAARSRRSSR